MSINPLSLGISSNFTVSSNSISCAQTMETADANTAASQDSVQLSAEENSLNVSSAPAQYSPPSAADMPHQKTAAGSGETVKNNDANKDESSVSKKDSAAPSKRTKAKKPVSEQELKDKQRKLDSINAELKINDDDHEILGDEQEEKQNKDKDKNTPERI